MDYLAILPLGFLIGITHAFEADHLAAVTALQYNRKGRIAIAVRGAIWGFGHTFSLLLVSAAVFLLGLTMTGRLEAGLEFAVGVMIVAIGANVLWRLRREKIHMHVHSHDDNRHIHFHSHAKENVPHSQSTHTHKHKSRAVSGKGVILGVGMVHGLAGSGAFLVLMSATADTFAQALTYVLVFGLGTILGMGFLTLIISLPLNYMQRLQGWVPATTQLVVAGVALFVGGSIMVEKFGELLS